MAAIFGYDDVGNHASMLVDPVRMRAFAAAIERAVGPDDVVVDVGSGTGVLALLCAKAGARRAYAIERGPMAKLIELAAAKNGFADVVRVIREDARAVEFAEKPTLIVSEMIGSFGLDEDYLGLLGAVRARCAPGCRVLPASVDIELSLARLPQLAGEIEVVRSGLGIRLDDVATMLLSRVALSWVDAKEVVASSTTPTRFVVGDPPPRAIGGRVVSRETGPVHALIGWFRSELVSGVSLTSAPHDERTHWANLIFPLDPPLDVKAGDAIDIEVRPRLLTDRGTWSWSARVLDDGDIATVRKGDAMKSLVGDRDDLMRQLGLRPTTLDPHDVQRLSLWAAALAGGVADAETMAHRIRAAFPGRFADDADAQQEIARLVRVAAG